MIRPPVAYLITAILTLAFAVLCQMAADHYRTDRAHRISHNIFIAHNVIAIIAAILVFTSSGHLAPLTRFGLVAITATLIQWRFWYVPLLLGMAAAAIFE